MRRIPDKIRHGDTPSRVPRAVNDIIDYLRQTVPVPGTGIRISETVNGNVFEADRLPPSGGSAGAPAGYSGYFKVIPGQAKGTLRIVDGANQNAAICGKTDVGDVPMETLTSQEGTLYLIMKAISATTYTQTFEWMIPSGAVGWTEIATVDSDGVITQRWTGNTIYWGQRYLI